MVVSDGGGRERTRRPNGALGSELLLKKEGTPIDGDPGHSHWDLRKAYILIAWTSAAALLRDIGHHLRGISDAAAFGSEIDRSLTDSMC